MPYEKDIELAKELVKGDERKFEIFFNEYFPRLYRFAVPRLGSDKEAVQDIVQTTMMNAMRAIATYRGEASMFTWLCQICRNEINAHFRRLSKSVPVLPQDDQAIRSILEALESDEVNDPGSSYESLQVKRLLQEILDHMPASYSNALEWKYIEGFSVAEIALRLSTTEIAAQSILARARTTFRDALTRISPQLLPSK